MWPFNKTPWWHVACISGILRVRSNYAPIKETKSTTSNFLQNGHYGAKITKIIYHLISRRKWDMKMKDVNKKHWQTYYAVRKQHKRGHTWVKQNFQPNKVSAHLRRTSRRRTFLSTKLGTSINIDWREKNILLDAFHESSTLCSDADSQLGPDFDF